MTAPTTSLRCSDAEREQVSSRLHEAAGEGRLTMTEVEERLAQAYSARYRHELVVLTEDLPPTHPPVTGWRDDAVRARTFLAALLGRGSTALNLRSRRLRLLAVLAFCIVVMSAAHGVFFEGGFEP
ncbi:DUF1707 domain-containing protein [Umezawaea endophytica]|uniref:DUF1707 domain-containing protein n=1 Tax=Umezawaea endophytica TaxID=1654476 RepID=A0A9X2VVM7_9PSEU|nr:DUF1707 domain-containing protein [Umezawaea endophytica]MCS7483790.1 DUF1707 domain-containing protein [Umezawaea endophytica]